MPVINQQTQIEEFAQLCEVLTSSCINKDVIRMKEQAWMTLYKYLASAALNEGGSFVMEPDQLMIRRLFCSASKSTIEMALFISYAVSALHFTPSHLSPCLLSERHLFNSK